MAPILNAADAAMISTDHFISHNAQVSSRDRLLIMLQKDDLQKKLEVMGVSLAEAKNRLASMSDAEIDQLEKKIDQLPAGADAADAILGTALTVFIVLLITDILCVTRVFKFTRCAGSH